MMASTRWPAWEPVYPEASPAARAIDLPRPRRSFAAELPGLVVAAFVIAFLVKSLVAQAFFIPSRSMVPTLEVGDRVVVSRLAYRTHEPHRGDVLVFEADDGGGNGDHDALPVRALKGFLETVGLRQPSAEDFIKRVIGLPGETLEGRNGVVYVDGRPLREPYLVGGNIGDFGPVTVPPGHLWMMGDNRGQSSDSRVFGPVAKDRVVGRALLRVWPPGRLGFL